MEFLPLVTFLLVPAAFYLGYRWPRNASVINGEKVLVQNPADPTLPGHHHIWMRASEEWTNKEHRVIYRCKLCDDREVRIED